MTDTRDWGLRSTQDDPTSQSWGGQNVFDVYTKSTERRAMERFIRSGEPAAVRRGAASLSSLATPRVATR